MKKYLFGLALALDLLVNAIFGGGRYQTISARWGEAHTRVWLWKWGSKFLNLFQKNHTEIEHAKYEKIKGIIDDTTTK